MGSLIDKEKLKAKAIEVIGKNKLIFIEDICAMCGVSKFTFYEKFPIDSNDYHELSKMLEENKIALKVGLRKKWYDSDNATVQMALYKLCSTDVEHKKLQQNYTDVTSGSEKIQTVDPFMQIRQNVGINDKTETSDLLSNG